MKNINFLGRYKKKSNIFLNSKTPNNSLFYYFLQNWNFFETNIICSIEKHTYAFKDGISFSKQSNIYLLNTSINRKIKTSLILQKNLRKRKIPTTSFKLNVYL